MIRLAVGVFFIALPFLELTLLVKLIYSWGFFVTLALLVVAGAIGATVIAQQSAGAFRQALEAASRGETPHAAVLDGMFLMLAGVFLVVPGLITDVMGLLLLIPPLRQWIARRAFDSVLRNAPGEAEDAPEPSRPSKTGSPRARPADGPVIEGEFQRLDERTPGQGRNEPPHS